MTQAERDRIILEYTQAVYARPGITPEAAAAEVAQAMDQFGVSPQEYAGAFQRDTTVTTPEQRAVFGDVGTVQQAYEAVRPTGVYSPSFVGPVSTTPTPTTPPPASTIRISPDVVRNIEAPVVSPTPVAVPRDVGPPTPVTSSPLPVDNTLVFNPANITAPVDVTGPQSVTVNAPQPPTREQVIRDYVNALYNRQGITPEEAALELSLKMDEVGVSPEEFSRAIATDTTMFTPEQRAVFGDLGTVQTVYNQYNPTGMYSTLSSGAGTDTSTAGAGTDTSTTGAGTDTVPAGYIGSGTEFTRPKPLPLPLGLVSESTAGLPYGGGFYKRTPQEQALYEQEYRAIPVRTTVPTPVIAGEAGFSRAMAPFVAPGGPGEEAGYARIRELLTSGQLTPEQIIAGKEALGVSDQDIDIAFGRRIAPIRTTTPTMPGATSTATPQSISEFIRSKAPTTPTVPATSIFSPEQVRTQLQTELTNNVPSTQSRLTDLYGTFTGARTDLNRLLQEGKVTPDQLKTMYNVGDDAIEAIRAAGITPYTEPTPVAGFAQGGLVGNDINQLLRNQQSAIQRESQSRQMLTNLGAPPVKKFSDGGPAGSSSSGVRRLKMSGYADGGEVTDDAFIQEMMTGTLPEEERKSLVDKKASELLRALSEGTRGFVGADPIEPGSEAYRTGQALANMPVVGAVAGTIKGAGRVRNLTKKDIKAIASELETSRGQLAELVKKYPQLLDASIADVEALTKGEPFTAYRGISLLPGQKLRSEAVPSTTLDPDVALGIIKEAPVMITKKGFITATPVLRQYPGMVASETQAYVPSVISQIRERQPGALEMKIPTRSGEKMTVEDIFKAVEKEKELLADVSKKEPQDILFNRYGGGVGDRYLMEVARKVMSGEWKGGQNLVEEIGGYQTDPKGLAQEFDAFAEMVKSKVMKKAAGGEVTNFIKRQAGSPPQGEISDDAAMMEMFTGTLPEAQGPSPVDTAVSDFISSRSKLVTDPKEFFRVMGENLETYHGKPLREDPEKYLMEQLGPGVLGGIIKPKGGNVVTQDLMESLKSLRPSVLYEGYRPASEADKLLKEQMKKEEESGRGVSAVTRRIFEENKPKAALDEWVQSKLGRYIRTEMGSEEDPVRRLGEEMTEKIRSNYETGLKRIAKMKEKIAEAKALGKNTDISEAELADEVDKVENAYRQTSKLPVNQGPYLYPRARTGEARKKAGFSPYPVSKSDAAKEWEETADSLFQVHRAGDLVEANSPIYQENPWIAKLDPDEIIYNPQHVDEPSMFTHTIDELENALNPNSGLPQNLLLKPEDMQQLSIDKAFRHVNKINDWRMQQRTAANLEEAQRAAVTYKEYPDSQGRLKWQELKAPEYTELPPGYSLEDMDYATTMLKDAQGNILTYLSKIDDKGAVDPLKQALSFLSKNDLERALKYEGSTMRHCVGTHCDSVFSGQTRIFSLRDSKGEPHITIETAPSRDPSVTMKEFFRQNPSLLKKPEKMSNFAYVNDPVFPWTEYNEWLKTQPEAVLQVKGKGNKKPSDRYIKFGQDFIASKNWSDIQDLENLDIVPLKPMMLKNAQDRGFNPQVITTVRDQPYITKEEFSRLSKLFSGKNNYAAGGEVTDFIKRVA